MASEAADASGSAAHVQSTRKVFTRWLNTKLSKRGLVSTDAIDDLRSGECLVSLVKILTGRDLSKTNKVITSEPGKMMDRSTRVHNVHSCLMYLGQSGVVLESVTAEGIVDGKVTMVLLFLWNLIFEFSVKPLLGSSRRMGVSQLCRQISGLLGEYLKGYSVVSYERLPQDFRDGTVLAALIHRKDYKLVDFYGAIRDRKPASELWPSLLAIVESLGVPHILDASDMATMDESLFVVFFVTFWPAYVAMGVSSSDAGRVGDATAAGDTSELHKKIRQLEGRIEDLEQLLKEEQASAETARQANLIKLKHKDDTLQLATGDVRNLELAVMELRASLAALTEDNHALKSSLEMIAAKELSFAIDTIRTAAQQPPDGRCTLVYVAAEASMSLWERAPTVMAAAMAVFLDIARKTGAQYHGYDASQDSETAMFAFRDVRDAATMAMVLQLRLLDAAWPAQLAEYPEVPAETSISGQLLFQGLRAIVCLHTGTPILRRSDGSDSVSYVGPVVITAQLLGQKAHGGQTLATESTWRDLEPAMFGLRISSRALPLGQVDLGENRSLKVIQLLPEQLADRRFPPLRTGATDELGHTPASRKVLLLQEKNKALSDKLAALSADVESSHQTVMSLASQLARMQYDVGGASESVLTSFIEEMQGVISTQHTLSSQMEQAQADHLEVSRHLQMLELSFEDEMRIARLQIQKHEEDLSRIWREGNKTTSKRAQQRQTTHLDDDGFQTRRLNELEQMHAAIKRQARKQEMELRPKIRALKEQVATLTRDRDIFAFKLASQMHLHEDMQLAPFVRSPGARVKFAPTPLRPIAPRNESSAVAETIADSAISTELLPESDSDERGDNSASMLTVVASAPQGEASRAASGDSRAGSPQRPLSSTPAAGAAVDAPADLALAIEAEGASPEALAIFTQYHQRARKSSVGEQPALAATLTPGAGHSPASSRASSAGSMRPLSGAARRRSPHIMGLPPAADALVQSIRAEANAHVTALRRSVVTAGGLKDKRAMKRFLESAVDTLCDTVFGALGDSPAPKRAPVLREAVHTLVLALVSLVANADLLYAIKQLVRRLRRPESVTWLYLNAPARGGLLVSRERAAELEELVTGVIRAEHVLDDQAYSAKYESFWQQE